MTTETSPIAEPQPELRRRRIPAGEARVAVFTRRYAAPIDDVWDACTNPDRLRRWYVPVTGDLRLGGTFEQAGMGSGEVARCEPPHLLKLSIGGGADEIELRLATGADGCTVLELQHATTIDQHEIGGRMFDAVFCWAAATTPDSSRSTGTCEASCPPSTTRGSSTSSRRCGPPSSAAAQRWPPCSPRMRGSDHDPTDPPRHRRRLHHGADP